MNFIDSVFLRLKKDIENYRFIFYSSKRNEISLVKCLCKVDGVLCVDRTKNGVFGHYQSKKKFLNEFEYVGKMPRKH